MKKLLLTLLLLVAASPAFAQTSCDKMEELRKEWIALEEKSSGGLFFSGTSEANRLYVLRRIMDKARDCIVVKKPRRRD